MIRARAVHPFIAPKAAPGLRGRVPELNRAVLLEFVLSTYLPS